MTMMQATESDQTIDLDKIIHEGKYYRLHEHALKDELMAKIHRSFAEGVEKFAGPAAREGIARDGLKNIHRHFPIEKIKLLEHHLMEDLRDDLYYWSARVGRDTLGIDHEFFVDHLIVIRIHYPHMVARKAKQQDIAKPPYPWTERMRLAIAAARNPEMLVYAARRAVAKKLEDMRKSKAHDYDAKKYHGNLATPARSHGAHVDTWYGHSYDGINLWLSIDGVNEGNTVILYPEMFGQEVRFDPVSMYLAEGQATPKPVKYAMEPGELLVLNPEMLHGTQVNISDETRVALTTRINPNTPRFAEEAPFHFEYWYSSETLARKQWGKMSVFPHGKYQGKPSWTKGAPYEHDNSRNIRVAAALGRDGGVVDVAAAGDLVEGARLCVDLADAKAMLWRVDDRIVAYSRSCPHMGIDIADGYHDGRETFCPGHGMGFSVADGTSGCEGFKLRRFGAEERDGRIVMWRATEA